MIEKGKMQSFKWLQAIQTCSLANENNSGTALLFFPKLTPLIGTNKYVHHVVVE